LTSPRVGNPRVGASASCPVTTYLTQIDSNVISSLYLCQLLPCCRARKCKHSAAVTVRSPRWR